MSIVIMSREPEHHSNLLKCNFSRTIYHKGIYIQSRNFFLVILSHSSCVKDLDLTNTNSDEEGSLHWNPCKELERYEIQGVDI